MEYMVCKCCNLIPRHPFLPNKVLDVWIRPTRKNQTDNSDGEVADLERSALSCEVCKKLRGLKKRLVEINP